MTLEEAKSLSVDLERGRMMKAIEELNKVQML